LLTIFSSSREVREQSLSRRENPPSGTPPFETPPSGTSPSGTPPFETPPSGTSPFGTPPSGTPPPQDGPGGPPESGKPPTEPVKDLQAALPKEPTPKGTNVKSLALNFLVGTVATMAGVSILKGITGGFSSNTPASPTSSANQNTPASSTSSANQNTQYQSTSGSTLTPQSGYTQNQNQQRAVDHGKRADIFGEPHSSHGL
jgi:hypothetical protein